MVQKHNHYSISALSRTMKSVGHRGVSSRVYCKLEKEEISPKKLTIVLKYKTFSNKHSV